MKRLVKCSVGKRELALLFLIGIFTLMVMNYNLHGDNFTGMDYLRTLVRDNTVLEKYPYTHRQEYGLPLSSFTQAFKLELTDWRIYFPQFEKDFNEFRNQNKLRDSDQFTSPLTTKVKVSRTDFKVGDVFTAVVLSMDRLGRPKTFGGDFFRARLVRDPNELFSDAVPLRVEDHSNGSYSLSAKLPIPGQFILEVTMVDSIEALDELIQWTSSRKMRGTIYIVSLSGEREKVMCDVDLDAFESLKHLERCDYSNPRNKEPWFCVKPSSGKCPPIYNIRLQRIIQNFTDVINTPLREKFGSLDSIQGSGQIIKVEFSPRDTEELPKCVVKNTGVDVKRPTGYFSNGHWHSLHCLNKVRSIQQIEICLLNKTVYFLGDSTIRQFVELILVNLKLSVVNLLPYYGHNPFVAYSTVRNITLYYRSHGPPLQNEGPPFTRPYISDSIHDIPVGGRDVVVIFNIGAHIMYFEPSVFIHRIKGIRDAILNHLSRYPNTRFIFRGGNVISVPAEWCIYRHDVIVREIFKDVPNVMFLDLWDFTTARPLNDYHPPNTVLTEQSFLMFDYLCNDV